MEFCDKCGSRMIRTTKGFECRKCGNTVYTKATPQLRQEKTNQAEGIYISTTAKDDYAKILRKCPKCGNKEAVHWFSGISGEHAGVMRERTVEHFKCTKCSHSWTES